MRWFLGVTIAGLVAATACNESRASSPLPFFNSKELTPEWGASAADVHHIAPFTLDDQRGEPFDSAALEGKIYIASFLYTSCAGICPPTVSNLLDVQRAFREAPEVELVSFSVTPETDDVETLRHFGETRGIVPEKWHLLTGDRAVIYGLARTAYFAERNPEADASAFVHTETLVLVDAEGRIRGVYNGTRELDIQRLIEDVELLRSEDTGTS